MKKLLVFIMVFSLALLAGCSSEEQTLKKENNQPVKEKAQSNNKNEEHDSQESEIKGFSLEYEGVKIPMNVKAKDILSRLPKENTYFESPSCAFQGLDKVYTYNGFELYTYELDKVDHIRGIVFIDDSIATDKGVKIGSSLDDMLLAHGNDYEENGSLYKYVLDETYLSFLVENNTVVSIEYGAVISDN